MGLREALILKKKILVVDDEPDIVDLIQSRLVRQGYEVICAYNGAEALRLIKSCMPHCIILDMVLPDIPGASVCVQLKADEQYHMIPIILLTARNRDYDKDAGLAVKADVYMTKPFNHDELLSTIQQLLTGKC